MIRFHWFPKGSSFPCVIILMVGSAFSAAKPPGDTRLENVFSAWDVTWLQALTPTEMAGYSIYIYHVTCADAARVRQRLSSPGKR
jgi:hypothetical protein